MRLFWICMISIVSTSAGIFAGAYLTHTVTLPWGLGELGYIGAVALCSTPAVIALFAALVAALVPRAISLGPLIFLPAPALYLALADGMGATLAWPFTQDQSTALLMAMIILLPLLILPGLLHAVLREKFRERVGIVPKQPALNG